MIYSTFFFFFDSERKQENEKEKRGGKKRGITFKKENVKRKRKFHYVGKKKVRRDERDGVKEPERGVGRQRGARERRVPDGACIVRRDVRARDETCVRPPTRARAQAK